MCGIHAVISNVAPAPLSPAIKEALCNRGPDYFGQHATRIANGDDSGATFLRFTSTVLSLRGDRVAAQPFLHPQTGSILCWNGEAWKIGGCTIQGNDGQAVFDLLSEASVSVRGEEAIIDVLRSIQGPFAFVYLDKVAGKVYYGRDRLGRRSLLASGSDDGGSLVLSSIADTCDANWNEVEVDGICVLNLVKNCSNTGALSPLSLSPSRYEWMVNGGEDLVSCLTAANFGHEVSCLSNLRQTYSSRS